MIHNGVMDDSCWIDGFTSKWKNLSSSWSLATEDPLDSEILHEGIESLLLPVVAELRVLFVSLLLLLPLLLLFLSSLELLVLPLLLLFVLFFSMLEGLW